MLACFCADSCSSFSKQNIKFDEFDILTFNNDLLDRHRSFEEAPFLDKLVACYRVLVY